MPVQWKDIGAPGVLLSGANPASMPGLVEPPDIARTTSGTNKKNQSFIEENNTLLSIFTELETQKKAKILSEK